MIRRSGFTLVELLVTIGIMLFVLGLAVVGTRAMLSRGHLATATGRVRAAIDGARSRAILYGGRARFAAYADPADPNIPITVSSDAETQAPQWTRLPDLILLAWAFDVTNAAAPAWRGRGEGVSNQAERLTISFDRSGAIARAASGKWNASTNQWDWQAASDPAAPVYVRITLTREPPEVATFCIYGLTGIMERLDQD